MEINQQTFYPNGQIKSVLNGSYFYTEYKELYDDGKPRLEGTYIEGKRQGVFLTWSKEGRMTSRVFYQDDKMHGPYTVWFYDGSILSGNTEEGENHGETILDKTHEIVQTFYVNNEKHGYKRCFDNNGNETRKKFIRSKGKGIKV